MTNDRITGIKWIPVGFLFVGLLLKWLHIDEDGILLNIGFISFGLAAFIDGIKMKYHKQFNTDIVVKLALPLVVILLSADTLLTGTPHYTILGVAILIQYMLGPVKSFILKKQ